MVVGPAEENAWLRKELTEVRMESDILESEKCVLLNGEIEVKAMLFTKQ